MRRISLALTLVGAFAAAGCGGGASSSGNGRAKGIPGVSYAVAVQTTAGGKVESGQLVGGVFTPDGEINCAPASGTSTCSALFPVAESIFLRATANAPTATVARFYFEGFAGDCADSGICELQPGADKFVSASFTQTPTAHSNWTDVAYGVKAHKLNLRCQNCHGSDLQGAGIAPACSYCHKPEPTHVPPADYSLAVDGHFDSTNEAWGPHGAVGTASAWSTACERCHTADGFRDYVGELDGSANNLSGTFLVSNPNPVTGDNVSQPGAYKWGTLGCNVCHNDVTDPLEGTHFNAIDPANPIDKEVYFGINGPVAGINSILFPSLLQVNGVQKGTGLCGTCHQARESTASVTSKIAGGVASANRGLGFGSIAGSTSAQTTTVLTGPKSAATADQWKGFTAIFNGASNKALNGVRAVIASNTAGVASTTAYTVTFATALPSVPSCTTFVTSATPVCDGAAVYPTATGGSNTTLVDSNRTWTAGKFVGYVVYFQTGANAGKFASITASDATSLTFADAGAAVAAGDFYVIAPNAAAVLDAVTTMSFTNPHYLGASATIFGAGAAGWYQYPGQNYAASGAFHTATNCTDCHGAHTGNSLGKFEVEQDSCATCHGVGASLSGQAALAKGDLDGNGTDDGIAVEISGLENKLYTALQAYTKISSGNQLCYTDAYPYMYLDANQNGMCDATETTSFASFTPRSLRGAYNLKWAHAEPGAWAHNSEYVARVLIDGINDLKDGITAKGGDASGIVVGTRP